MMKLSEYLSRGCRDFDRYAKSIKYLRCLLQMHLDHPEKHYEFVPTEDIEVFVGDEGALSRISMREAMSDSPEQRKRVLSLIAHIIRLQCAHPINNHHKLVDKLMLAINANSDEEKTLAAGLRHLEDAEAKLLGYKAKFEIDIDQSIQCIDGRTAEELYIKMHRCEQLPLEGKLYAIDRQDDQLLLLADSKGWVYTYDSINGQLEKYFKVNDWILDLKRTVDDCVVVLTGKPEKGKVSVYKQSSLIASFDIDIFGTPCRGLHLDRARNKLYCIEGCTATECNTLVEIDLSTQEIKRLELPCSVWSICLHRDAFMFGMSLQGLICRVDLVTHEIETLQLVASEKPKTFFTSLSSDGSRLYAASYQCTPKEDDSCPNTICILDEAMRLLSTVKLELRGKIFCFLYHMKMVSFKSKPMLACSVVYNDKGYGDRCLLLVDCSTQLIYKIDDAIDELVTNLDFHHDAAHVFGLHGAIRRIDFK